MREFDRVLGLKTAEDNRSLKCLSRYKSLISSCFNAKLVPWERDCMRVGHQGCQIIKKRKYR